MRKYVLTLAVLAAAALPSLAMAGETEQVNAVVAAGPTQMSDGEMDNVTAGAPPGGNFGVDGPGYSGFGHSHQAWFTAGGPGNSAFGHSHGQ